MIRTFSVAVVLILAGSSPAEDIYSVPIVDKKQQLEEKWRNQLEVIAIENGVLDQVIVYVRYGKIIQWKADLSVGGKLFPLNSDNHDLGNWGKRIELGDAFTKEDMEKMTVTNITGILK